MSLYKLLIILFITAVCLPVYTVAQRLDSLMSDRESKFIEYTEFKSNMSERTWINLIDLGKHAEAVIDADNELIRTQLKLGMTQNRELSAVHEKLKMELNLVENESKKNESQNAEIQQLNNALLLFISILVVVLFVALIFLNNLYKKNRQTTFELERFWSMRDEQSLVFKEREKELMKEFRLLEIENKAMHKEFTLLTDQKLAAKKKLDQEIQSRRKVEQEIKGLIGQLKKN